MKIVITVLKEDNKSEKIKELFFVPATTHLNAIEIKEATIDIPNIMPITIGALIGYE